MCELFDVICLKKAEVNRRKKRQFASLSDEQNAEEAELATAAAMAVDDLENGEEPCVCPQCKDPGFYLQMQSSRSTILSNNMRSF